MNKQERRDDLYDHKRVATERDKNERGDDESPRYDRSTRNEQLTRREREERWPVG
jgi:hypothetical protein